MLHITLPKFAIKTCAYSILFLYNCYNKMWKKHYSASLTQLY